MDQSNGVSPLHITIGNNQITFTLDQNIYPRDIILKTCYAHIDRMYFLLDIPKAKIITVTVKGKERLASTQLENFKDDFLNELLNALLMKRISRQNQKQMEYIVGGAITASLEKADAGVVDTNKEDAVDLNRIEREIEALKKELEAEMDAA